MLGHCYFYRMMPGFTVLSLFLSCSYSSLCLAAGESHGLKFSKRCLMVNPNEGCAIADVNRDGKLDIIAGTHWYAAPDFIPRPVRDIPQVSLGFGSKGFYANNGDHVHDVDGDGWPDVISGGWTVSELYWYKNPGKEGLEKGWKWGPHLLVDAPAEN